MGAYTYKINLNSRRDRLNKYNIDAQNYLPGRYCGELYLIPLLEAVRLLIHAFTGFTQKVRKK